MNIAELFINLGIKGTDKTVSGIASVQKGLKETASTSLEAKAAIVGAMYALERLFATSGQAGTELTNFTSLLGVSAKSLQQYQYAARQAGVSNQAVEGTFKALANTATNTLLGKGAPEGLARISQVTKMQVGQMLGLLNQASKGDVIPLFKVLDQYARLETNSGFRNKNLKDMGVSEDIIAASVRNKFTPNILNAAPTYSDKEISALDRANIAWSNLGTNIEMAVGHFNAMHGGQLVNDISTLVPKVLELAGAFVKVAEQLKIFQLVSESLKGWSIIFDGISKAVESIAKNEKLFSALSEINPVRGVETVVGGVASAATTGANALTTGAKGAEARKDSMEAFKGFFSVLAEAWREMGNSGTQDPSLAAMLAREGMANGAPAAPGVAPAPRSNVVQLPTARSVAPAVPAAASGGGAPVQNVEVNQHLIFNHDGKDHQRAASEMKRAVKDAYRQMPAQAQGS